jgi:hypothetical protein
MSKPNKKRTSPKPGVTALSKEPAEREERNHSIPGTVRGQADAREGPLEGGLETEEAVAKVRATERTIAEAQIERGAEQTGEQGAAEAPSEQAPETTAEAQVVGPESPQATEG